jgi:hypothetical protein
LKHSPSTKHIRCPPQTAWASTLCCLPPPGRPLQDGKGDKGTEDGDGGEGGDESKAWGSLACSYVAPLGNAGAHKKARFAGRQGKKPSKTASEKAEVLSQVGDRTSLDACYSKAAAMHSLMTKERCPQVDFGSSVGFGTNPAMSLALCRIAHGRSTSGCEGRTARAREPRACRPSSLHALRRRHGPPHFSQSLAVAEPQGASNGAALTTGLVGSARRRGGGAAEQRGAHSGLVGQVRGGDQEVPAEAVSGRRIVPRA